MFTKGFVTTCLAAVAAAGLCAATLCTAASPLDISAQHTSTLRVRKNIDSLSKDELANLRHAFAMVIARGQKDPHDMKGYAYWTSIHSDSSVGYCVHNDPRFSPWHRWYLLQFENVLRDSDPQKTSNVTLPYWDWTDKSSGTHGYPKAAEQPDANSAPNSLYWPNPVTCKGRSDEFCKPRRQHPPGQIPYSKDLMLEVLNKSWKYFGGMGTGEYRKGRLESEGHGNIHTEYTQSAMGHLFEAPNDPLFWFMHANVDRLLQTWQMHKQDHPCTPGYPQPPWPPLNDPLAPIYHHWPMGIKVGDTLCIDRLRYTYDKLHDVRSPHPYPPRPHSSKDFTAVAAPREGGQLAPVESSLPLRYKFTVPDGLIEDAHVIIPGVTTPKRGAYQLRVYLHPTDEDYKGQEREFADRYYAGQTTVMSLSHLTGGKPVEHETRATFAVNVADKLNQVISAAHGKAWAAAVVVTRLLDAPAGSPLANDSRPFIEIDNPETGPRIDLKPAQ